MDPRELLIQQMDAAAAGDIAVMVATARLNWRLIDAYVLGITASRITMMRVQEQSIRDTAEILRRVDLQMAALTGGTRTGGATTSGFVDPRTPVFEAVHNMLALVAQHQGEPLAETPPALAARALDILENRLPIEDAVKLVAAAAPAGQAGEFLLLQFMANIPYFAEKLVVPIVRSAAAGAVSLSELFRLFPAALIAGQPPPPIGLPRLAVMPRPTVAPSSPAPGFGTSLVEALLHDASQASPRDADELFRRAIAAAAKTVPIDDDIAVLQRLIQSIGRVELSAATIHAAAELLGNLAQRTEQRDDVAFLLAWVIDVVVQRGMLGVLGARLVASSRAVLGAELGPTAWTRIATSCAEALARLGKPDGAARLLDLAQDRVSEPALLLEVELARGNLRAAAGDHAAAVTTLSAFLAGHATLPTTARRRALTWIVGTWPTGRPGVGRWVDELLALADVGEEPSRTFAIATCAMALVRTGGAADRARARTLIGQVDLAATRARLEPTVRAAFDAATAEFATLARQLTSRHVAIDAPRIGAPPASEVLAALPVRAALGGSLIPEELRGDFSVARQAAEAAGELEQCLVDLLSGRSGAARRRLAQLSAATTDEPQRVTIAGLARCAARIGLGQVLHIGALFDDLAGRVDTSVADPRTGDPRLVGSTTARELRLLWGNCVLAIDRDYVSNWGHRGYPADHVLPIALPDRPAGATVADLLTLARSSVSKLVRDLGPEALWPCSTTWMLLADIDLVRRSGDKAAALEAIRATRARCEHTKDLHGAGLCWLAEGDVLACAIESPATLGLCLERTTGLDHGNDARVEDREQARVADDELAAARAAFATARQYFAAAGAPRGLAAIELRRAGLAAITGDHVEARERADVAENMFAAAGDDCRRYLARVHTVLADVARARPVDPGRVRAIGAWGSGDGDLSHALGLGSLLARAGRRWLLRDAGYEQAVRCARLAEELFIAAGAPIATAQALGDQSNAHLAIRDRDAAIAVLERAAEKLALVSASATQNVPAPPQQTSVRLTWTSVDDEASGPHIVHHRVRLQHAAWSLAQSAPNPDEMEHLAAQLVNAATALGADMESKWLAGLVDKAAQATAATAPQYRARALELDPTVSDARRQDAWQAAIAALATCPEPDRWLYLGLLHNERGDRAAASEYCARYFALDPALPLSLPPDTPPELVELARRVTRLNHTKQAFSAFVAIHDWARARAALTALVTLDGEDWWKRDSTPWVALANHGDLRYAEGDPTGALASYEAARDLLETQGAMLRDDSSKTAFADSPAAKRLFAHTACAALALSPPDRARAFDFLEHGRARALADLVSDARAAPAGNDPIARWREASARRDLVRTLIGRALAADKPDADRVATLQRQLTDREAEVLRLETEARAQSPARFQALDARAAVAPLSEVVQRIPIGVVVIEFSITDELLLGWALTRDGMTATVCREVDDRVLRRDARAFQQACAHPGKSLASRERLAEALLMPFADAIRGAAQVVFVVSGELSLVPFHALPFDGDALIARIAVSYAPSASLLGVLTTQPVAGEPILVVGDPPGMALTVTDGTKPLPALPGARLEAVDIAALVKGSRLLIDNAHKTAVASALPQFRVVHLATHGVVDRRSPWLSAILLARGDQLTVSDLMGLALAADLVVLSACDSGTGEVTQGEEVLGLARGLLAAGARAVIVSLWSVYDQPTRQLMVELHRRLQAGARPADALRAAQLHVRGLDPAAAGTNAAARSLEGSSARRKIALAGEPALPASDYGHPVCWAPFVLVGV